MKKHLMTIEKMKKYLTTIAKMKTRLMTIAKMKTHPMSKAKLKNITVCTVLIAKMNPTKLIYIMLQMKTHLMLKAKMKIHLMTIAKILQSKSPLGYIIHPLKLKRKNSIFNVLIKDYLNVINLMFNILFLYCFKMH